MKKRIISFFMVVAIIATTFPFADFLQLNIANAAGDTVILDDGRVVTLPPGVPKSKLLYGKTYELNKELLVDSGITSVPNLDSGLAVYGTPKDISGNEYKQGEWRYIGFDMVGNKYTNPDFPMDADSGRSPSQKDWIKMYDYGLVERSMYFMKSKQQCGQWLQTMIWLRDLECGGKLPEDFDVIWLAEHFHILSPPGEYTAGLARGWHKAASGKLWYETFVMPPEKTIDVPKEPPSVKADFNLKDQIYEYQDTGYQDFSSAQNSYLEYEKLTIKKGSEVVFTFENNSGPNIKLKEGYYEFELYVKNNAGQEDKKVKHINVIKQIDEAESEPIAVVNAPNTAYVNENFIVSAKGSLASTGAKIINYEWFIGDNESNLIYASEYDGKEEIQVNYANPSFKYFQVKITDTRGKIAQSNVAVTEIIDNTPTNVTARVDAPDQVYEGVPFEVETYGSKVIYGTTRLSAIQAVEKGIADYSYDLSCDYIGKLRADGGTIRVDKLGMQTVEYELSTNNAKDKSVDTFEVIETPYPDFKVYGGKVNRKLTVDLSFKKVHEDYPLAEEKVTIKYIKTGETATSTGSENKHTTNIKIKRIENNNVDFLVKKDGDYEISYYAKDIRGKEKTIVKRKRIAADSPPVADILVNEKAFRDETGIAKIEIAKNGYSIDGDLILVNDLKYKYDTDNDGLFTDETFVNLSSSLNEKEIILETDKVGKILLDYTVKEDLSPETIPEFVSSSDYLNTHTTKVIEVDNYAPRTSLRLINNQKVDMLVVGDKSDISIIQDKVSILKTNLNNNPGIVVNLDDTITDSALSNELIKKIATVPFNEKVYRVFGNDDNIFVYSTESNKVYIQDIKTGSILKMINVSNYKMVYAYVKNGKAHVVTDRAKYHFYDSNTGYTTYKTTPFTVSPREGDINDKLGLVLFSLSSNYFIFDIQGKVFYTVNGKEFNKSNIVKKEGSRLYYIMPTTYDKTGYDLKCYDLSTDTTTTVKSYKVDCGFVFRDTAVTFLETNNNELILYKNSSSNYNFTKFDLNTMQFSEYATVNIAIKSQIQYYDALNDRTYKLNLWKSGCRINYDDITDTIFLLAHNSYAYFDDDYDSRDRFYLKDLMIKVKPNLGIAKYIETYNLFTKDPSDYNNTWFNDYAGAYNGYLYLHSYNYNNHSGQHRKYDNNLKLVKTFSHGSQSPYRQMPGNEFGEIEQSGVNVYDFYYVKRASDDYETLYHFINNSAIRIARACGPESKDYYLRVYRLTDENGNKWILGTSYKVSATDDYIKEVFVVDCSTDTVYYDNSSVITGGYKYPNAYLIKNNKLWMFSDFKWGYFDLQTKSFTPLWGVTVNGFNYDAYEVIFMNSADAYLHLFGISEQIDVIYLPDSFKQDIIKKIDSFIVNDDSQKYITVITDELLSLNSTEIDEISNKAKSKGLKIIWVGKANNITVGQALVSKTGGVVYTYTDFNNAFLQIENYVKSQLPPKESNYVINIKKGEKISYEQFYLDMEKDLQIGSTVKWLFRHTYAPEGKASFSDIWRTTPITTFDKSGTYYASWDVQDNPKPADTNSKFSSYRRNAVRDELQIVVDGAEQKVLPDINISIEGDLRENHRVDFVIDVIRGNKPINMTSLNISFDKTDSLPNTKPNTLKFSRVFATSGAHNITVKIKDVDGNETAVTKSFTIGIDKAPSTGMTLTGDSKRDSEGLARFKINNAAAATDDPMGNIEYFIEDIKYIEDGESFIPNGTQYYPLELQGNELVTTKLGNTNIKQKVTDFYINGVGLNGEDLDQYRKFKTAEMVRTINVTNDAPEIEYKVLPSVVKTGNKVKHKVDIEDDTIGGDYVEYKFIHDAAYYTNDHGQHENNNIITTEPLQTLDKKGKYDFYARAVDEDGANSEWVFGGSVLACTEPAAEFDLISEPAYNSGRNTELKDDTFSSGSIITVVNRSFNEDYGYSVPNEGIKYLKIEYKDAAEEDYMTIFEADDMPAYIPTFNLPMIENRAVYDIKMTVGSPEGFYSTLEKQFTVLDLRMDAELDPGTVYASQSYKIKATLSKDGLGVTAYIPYLGAKDDPASWVTLSKVSEDALNKYYEAEINTEATLKDDIYDIKVFGMYSFNNEIEKVLPLTVNTPIELKSDIKPDGPNEYIRVIQDNLDSNDYIELPAGEKIKIAAEIISPVVQEYVKAKLEGEDEIDLVLNSTTGKYEALLNVPSVKPDKDYYTLNINTRTPNGNVAQNTHRVKLLTPINLITNMPNDVVEDTTAVIKAETSKYVEHLTVKLFKGKTFEKTVNLTSKLNGNKKEWSYAYEVPTGLPEGIYTAEFRAVTYNNNVDIKNETFKLQTLNLKDLRITNMINHPQYDGKYPILYSAPSVPVNYKTGYYVTFKIDAQGDPDAVKMKISYPGYNKTFNMTKESQNGSDSVWRLEWYSDPFTPKGTVINTVVTAEKDTTVLNFNNKYGFNGDYLKVTGSIEGDVRIDQEY